MAAHLATTPAAFADPTISFDEGAPKDRLLIVNESGCELSQLSMVIDLSGSASGLAFDVTGQRAGVEVFQPFELVCGADLFLLVPHVANGTQRCLCLLSGLGRNRLLPITIDVDDTMGAREIVVSGSEIQGAMVRADNLSGTLTSEFGTDGVAVLKVAVCDA